MNITQILLGLIFILGGVITLIVWPYIKAHVSNEQLTMLAGIAQTVVFAAEKIFGAKMGEDKLAYALNLAKKLLEKKGLSFDEETIRAAIEAQVEQLNLDQKAVEGGA
ncbi:MAG: phage holin [Bacilli bacterium]|nr:phage holin [Bacilli bacterium]